MCFDFRRARSHPLAPTIHRPLYRVGRQCTRRKKAMSRQRSADFVNAADLLALCNTDASARHNVDASRMRSNEECILLVAVKSQRPDSETR